MHQMRPSDGTGYDECDRCGILADPAIETWLLIPCDHEPCPATGGVCVFILEDGSAVCSYCDRDGTNGDDETGESPWTRGVRVDQTTRRAG